MCVDPKNKVFYLLLFFEWSRKKGKEKDKRREADKFQVALIVTIIIMMRFLSFPCLITRHSL